MSEDGGPAFPVPGPTELTSNGIITDAYSGMSLRDYFAGQALSNLALRSDGSYSEGARERKEPENEAAQVASAAYRYADAMLKSRASTQQGE